MAWRIGVDIGGTFTDVAMVDETTGNASIAKVSTTPDDFGRAVVEGIEQAMREYAISGDAVSIVSHATTVVTNALLEQKGANVALVATAGFRDVLELRRSARADLYDLNQDPPSVLVARRNRFEVDERIDAQGEVVQPISEASLDALIDALHDAEFEAIAVTLMFSFLNDTHEQRVAERIRRAFPDKPVFLSSEVLPEIREFERTSTTAVCAYVGPILESYLRRLEAVLADLGLPPLYVMGSNGGVFDVAEGLKMPAMAVESGPAAGVIAAAKAGAQLSIPDIISFDMGGTTAKASLIKDGQVETTSEYEVGGEGNVNRWLHGTGHPIRVPVIDLAEVSAGGGSIAWIDPGGALRVGPRSAGAMPGPVAYGRGGTEPTVTDANVVLGYLSRDSLLGGALAIEGDAAERAVHERLGEPLGISAVHAARGVIEVVNNAMAEALRIVSVERGHDPREFALMAFGGAGPIHALALAEVLDIPQVIIPSIPGGFSALGLVATDLRRDYSKTFYALLNEADPNELERAFTDLDDNALDMLAHSGVATGRQRTVRSADLRYVKQAYELNVTIPSGITKLDDAGKQALADAFHSKHKQTYGHESRDEPVQLVNIRVTAIGELPEMGFRAAIADPVAGEGRAREVYFDSGQSTSCPLLSRGDLSDHRVAGPFIVEELDTTIVVPPGWQAKTDEHGFIRVTRS